jgi:hypothetical protein
MTISPIIRIVCGIKSTCNLFVTRLTKKACCTASLAVETNHAGVKVYRLPLFPLVSPRVGERGVV